MIPGKLAGMLIVEVLTLTIGCVRCRQTLCGRSAEFNRTELRGHK